MRMASYKSWAVLSLALVCIGAGPDEDILGKGSGYPIGTQATAYTEPFRVGSFSAMDRIFPAHVVRHGTHVLALPAADHPPVFRYRLDGQEHGIEEYLQRQRVTALLIIKDGRIAFERYQYDRKDTQRLLSNSIAKSILSLAVGVALGEGKIASLDDPAAKYEPKLAGCAYGQTPLRALLRMSSGVHFVEDYSGQDDLARFSREDNRNGMIAALRLFNQRDVEPGQRMAYASVEAAALAVALHGATGRSLSDYVSEKIWQPLGAEADASWIVDKQGMERAYGFFNAVARDYGRLGWLLANDGALDGRQIVPREYLLDATDWRRQPPAFAPGKATAYAGYGYLFWLWPGQHRRFAMLGIYGQAIFVDPELKLVMVHLAVGREATDKALSRERDALWRGVVRAYGAW